MTDELTPSYIDQAMELLSGNGADKSGNTLEGSAPALSEKADPAVKESDSSAGKKSLEDIIKDGKKKRSDLIEELKPYSGDRALLAFMTKDLSKKYGITQKTLNSILGALEADAQAEKACEIVEITEPWDKPVDFLELARELLGLVNRYVVCSKEDKAVLVMWALLTWFYRETTYAPPLVITAPERSCGKSSAANLIKDLSCNSIFTISPTPAIVYRVKEKIEGVSLFFDEADTFFNTAGAKDITSIINSGVNRGGTVLRVESDEKGKTREVTAFPCFGFHAVIGIGCDQLLEPTLLDRSLVIRLDRATNEQCKKIGDYLTDREFPDLSARMAILRQKCAALAIEYESGLKERLEFYRNKENLPEIQGRQRQKWMPILALADVITRAQSKGFSGDISETTASGQENFRGYILNACRALTAEDRNLDKKEELLSHVGMVFMKKGQPEFLSGFDICQELNSQANEWPYSEFFRGNGVTAIWLSRKITELDKAKISRDKRDNKNGYLWEGIKAIMEKYLPHKVVQEILTNKELA
jgi:hypothetical protein